MTHASKSMDAWEEIQRIRESLQAEMQRADAMAAKLDAERAQMETRLAIANALALLRSINTRDMSTGQRAQTKGVIEQLTRAIAA